MAEPTRPIVEHEDRPQGRLIHIREPRLGWDVDAKVLKVALLELIGGQTRAAIDFSRVRYVASPTIGTILSVNRDATAAGCRIVFYGLQPYVRETFAALKIDRILTLCHTEAEAWALLTG